MPEAVQDNKEEIALETPAGKLKIRGSDFLAIAVLTVSICGFTLGYFLLNTHKEDAEKHGGALITTLKEFTIAQRESVKEQRILNCILVAEQKDRRRVLDDCERIAR